MAPNGRFSDAFVKPDGPRIDRETRLSPDFSLKEELLIGCVNVLTEIDCLEWHNEGSKNTSYFYNTFSRQLVGNYENWVFARPVKDWCLTTSECALGDLDKLMGMGMLKVSWGDVPPAMGGNSTIGFTWDWESLNRRVWKSRLYHRRSVSNFSAKLEESCQFSDESILKCITIITLAR